MCVFVCVCVFLGKMLRMCVCARVHACARVCVRACVSMCQRVRVCTVHVSVALFNVNGSTSDINEIIVISQASLVVRVCCNNHLTGV